MHVIPTPAKGGRYLNYLCTEFLQIFGFGWDTQQLV